MSTIPNILKTYVHNGQEVKLTGRKASPPATDAPVTKRRSAAAAVAPPPKVVYEIYDANDEGGFKRWVPLDELYEITNLKTKENDDG